MPRQITFAGPAEDCAALMKRLSDLPGVVRITLQPGTSKLPEGDVLTLEAANQTSGEILNVMSDLGLLHKGAVSIAEPNATIPAKTSGPVDEEGNDAIWEEIGAMLRQDTNPSFNFLALMALAGAVAAFGIAADTIHIVVGAMLIAPGFEPLLRTVFGVLGDRHSATAGLKGTAYGYLVLAVTAAAVTPLALTLNDLGADELAAGYWAKYWSETRPAGVATSLLAGVAGGIIVSSRLKVLGTGVMVALALIPTMTLIGMGLATGLPDMVWGAAGRWVVEMLCVIVGGGAILALKRKLLHRRGASSIGSRLR
ncbi:DUF389 domain-containing protein [Halodurantibacterium flavum]|uniref:DUF389 domain-containing protein n=1 Tax=Halodurantibacterium flavum TaxID=1382802 RepID=A0ABW4S0I3_9RHOB